MNSCLDSDGVEVSSKSDTRRVHVLIAGRVQGVFFRAETRRQASGLDLTGWVRNLEDRRVEVVFEGGKDAVEEMLDWCRKGPRLSHVTGVEILEEQPTGSFNGFRIRH